MSAPEAAALLRPENAPPFSAPWEAQAFAIAVALCDRGVFTSTEWAEALGAELKSSDASADGSSYYAHWLAAAEKLVAAKNVASVDLLASRKAAWDRAAHATPHGREILLENDPHAGA